MGKWFIATVLYSYAVRENSSYTCIILYPYNQPVCWSYCHGYQHGLRSTSFFVLSDRSKIYPHINFMKYLTYPVLTLTYIGLPNVTMNFLYSRVTASAPSVLRSSSSSWTTWAESIPCTSSPSMPILNCSMPQLTSHSDRRNSMNESSTWMIITRMLCTGRCSMYFFYL